VKIQDQQRHKKFKHGYISRNIKATIKEQIESDFLPSSSSNMFLSRKTSSMDENACKCKIEEFHRIISMDEKDGGSSGESEEEEGLLD
jgi:hypothetical protein